MDPQDDQAIQKVLNVVRGQVVTETRDSDSDWAVFRVDNGISHHGLFLNKTVVPPDQAQEEKQDWVQDISEYPPARGSIYKPISHTVYSRVDPNLDP